jgi:hypothetical protein
LLFVIVEVVPIVIPFFAIHAPDATGLVVEETHAGKNGIIGPLRNRTLDIPAPVIVIPRGLFQFVDRTERRGRLESLGIHQPVVAAAIANHTVHVRIGVVMIVDLA